MNELTVAGVVDKVFEDVLKMVLKEKGFIREFNKKPYLRVTNYLFKTNDGFRTYGAYNPILKIIEIYEDEIIDSIRNAMINNKTIIRLDLHVIKTLAHELTHWLQYELHEITPEDREVPYEDRWYEKEANEISSKVVLRYRSKFN